MRAAIYCRVSSVLQEQDGTSLETQEAACRTYAGRSGLVIDDDYVHREVFTGTELWSRPLLTTLREAIRAHAVDVVICYAIDRLSRDPVHLGVILSEAEHANIRVDFVTEPLDASPEGQLIRFVRGYAAKVEHEKLKERTLRGRHARIAKQGKLAPSSHPLFGYRWRDGSDKGAYDINPTTGPIVQRIYADLVCGRALRSIARALTDEGIPTPAGERKMWAHSTVRYLIMHPGYKGEAYGWCWRDSTNHTFDISQAIRLSDGTIPPLVDVVTWDRAQQVLELNKARAARNNRHPEAALLRGGFAVCGHCGRTLHVRMNGQGLVLYGCSGVSHGRQECTHHSISACSLDNEVWRRVEATLSNPNRIAEAVERLKTDDPTSADLKAVDVVLRDVERRQKNLIRELSNIDSEEVAAAVRAELGSLDQRGIQLHRERESVLERQAAWASADVQLSQLSAWCSRVTQNLSRLTYDERRLALDALGIRVQLFRKENTPRYVITADIPLTAIVDTARSAYALPAMCHCGGRT